VNAPNESKKEVTELGAGIYLCLYSERSVALFGDTKPVKDRLKEIGGKWNGSLEEPKGGGRAGGWIFKREAKQLIVDQVGQYAQTQTLPPLAAAPAPVSSPVAQVASSATTTNSVLANFPRLGVYLVEYSAKAIAVLGDTKPIKSTLLSLKGRFNSSLADPSKGEAKSAGWIFSKAGQADLMTALSAAVAAGSGSAKGKEPPSKKPKINGVDKAASSSSSSSSAASTSSAHP
jgi:hypothetical protein